jgi:hypothetical protein
MLKIIFHKDKITATKFNGITKAWEEYDIAGDKINKYFNRIVEIKPDVTVEDFMNHLHKYEDIINECFIGFNNEIPLVYFVEEMNTESTVDTNLAEIELYWVGEVQENDMAVLGFLRGWLKEEVIQELGQEYEIPHEMTFLPINIWKKCQFTLNENLIIKDFGTSEMPDDKILFDGFYSWTLFEVISNFLAELTCHGTPEERNKKLKQLEDRKFDAAEVSKDREQSEFWLQFLEVELEETKNSLSIALEEEDYEYASKCKIAIDAIEQELADLKKEIEKRQTNEPGTNEAIDS